MSPSAIATPANIDSENTKMLSRRYTVSSTVNREPTTKDSSFPSVKLNSLRDIPSAGTAREKPHLTARPRLLSDHDHRRGGGYRTGKYKTVRETLDAAYELDQELSHKISQGYSMKL